MFVRLLAFAFLVSVAVACGGASASDHAMPGESCNYDKPCTDGFVCSTWYYPNTSGAVPLRNYPPCFANCVAFVAPREGEACDGAIRIVPPSFVVRRCSSGLFCDGAVCKPQLLLGAKCARTPRSDYSDDYCDGKNLPVCASGLQCGSDGLCATP